MAKFFISKLKDGSILAWSTARTYYTKSLIYIEHFKNYEDFKITNKIYKLTQNKKVIKLNF